jgi:hypothetical protein
MNKIDELVKQCFWNYDRKQKERLSVNTRVWHNYDHSYLFLFKNLIATNDIKNKILHIDFKGFTTKTTKNRLNAILSQINYRINYHKGLPLLDNHTYLLVNKFYEINYK